MQCGSRHSRRFWAWAGMWAGLWAAANVGLAADPAPKAAAKPAPKETAKPAPKATAKPAPAVAAKPAALDTVTAAFFQKHCVRCHGEKKVEGDLRLDKLSLDLADPATFDRWQQIAVRLRAGEMPPNTEPRPPAADVAAVLRRTSQRLDEAVLAKRAQGRVVLRRLNRTEYENAVRDLFAVDVEVRAMLPEDSISLGFDNVGAALNVSPVLVERYLEAADAVLTAATAPVAKAPPEQKTVLLKDSLPEWFKGVHYEGDEVILFRSESTPTHIGKWRARETGRYRFKVHARAYQSEKPLAMAALAGNFNTAAGSARQIGYFDVQPGKPQIIEFEAYLLQRETIKVQAMSLPRVFLRQEAFPEYPGPGLAIGAIDIEGPLAEAWPTGSYRRVYGDVADPKKGTLADAEKSLRALLPKAFRRPTTDADLAPYLKLVSQALDAGQSFDEALRGGIKGVLCSPKFLYLKEAPGPLDDYALASRLSFYLWSSLPDEELLALAAKGELRKPAVLLAQAERLLKDPKSRRFTENFTGQWLSLRDIEFTTPDSQLYPEFDELLQWSMLRETELFFDELLQNDLTVRNFIDSDFSILNGRLAEHYGIPGVTGVEMRKTPLKPEYHRGGVLTHASVLKVTANGTTTSPVVRGVWVADHILGRPPKPPPANVPAIEPDIRGAVSIREQLDKHRSIASCAACHAQIDPPGFALENYDVIGGWRDKYRALGTKTRVQPPPSNLTKYLAKPAYGLGSAVDAGYVLSDGRKFADLEQFKRLILADPDQIARTVTEKLMVYATGGALEYGDQKEIERIVAATKGKNHGLRTLVLAVVTSDLFRNK